VVVASIALGVLVPVLAALPAIRRGVRVDLREALESTGSAVGGQDAGDRLLRRAGFLPRTMQIGLRGLGRRRRRSLATAVIVALAVGNAVLGMALGLFVSAFAQTEFQAVQFMPAIVFPQMLLCGLIVARDDMAHVLRAVSWALPLTYAYDALDRVTHAGTGGAPLARDVAVLVGATLLALGLGALTLRRRTP
jgi:hypothetical protein